MNITLIAETFASFVSFLKFCASLDTPDTKSGDHENENLDLDESELYDADGKLYGDCVKKAVHIREIQSHAVWFHSTNNMFFLI